MTYRLVRVLNKHPFTEIMVRHSNKHRIKIICEIGTYPKNRRIIISIYYSGKYLIAWKDVTHMTVTRNISGYVKDLEVDIDNFINDKASLWNI